ncbi:MAG: hypothetical protein Q4P32_06075 [Micrococcales bacterium]|nr:hypothetical protein [Micrococcales bacterium]
MSQMPALARTDFRPTPAPTRRGSTPVRSGRSAPAHLRLITAAPRPARQMPFIVLCSIVLAAGLLAVLFLNMQLAKGSYALHDLQRRSTILAEQQSQLTEHLTGVESPGVLASKATKLGMVPGSSPAFLRLPDGQVLGVPQAAPAASPTAPVSKAKSTTPSAAPTNTPVSKPGTSAAETPSANSASQSPASKAPGTKASRSATAKSQSTSTPGSRR